VRERPISHTKSATWMARRDLESLATPGDDLSQSQSWRRGKVNGLAAPSVAGTRHRGRRQYKRASPKESVAKVEGITIVKRLKASPIQEGIAERKRSQSRRYYRCETIKGVVNTSISSFTSPIPTGRKDCGGR